MFSNMYKLIIFLRSQNAITKQNLSVTKRERIWALYIIKVNIKHLYTYLRTQTNYNFKNFQS